MTADAGFEAFIKSLVLNLGLHFFALSLEQLSLGFVVRFRIRHDFCNFVKRIRLNEAGCELLVQDEAVQVVRETATNVGANNRQERDGVGNGKVTGHGDKFRIGLTERGSAQFNFERDFAYGSIGRIFDPKGSVVGAELDVEGRFNVDNGENVDPSLETKALHCTVEAVVAQQNFICDGCRFSSFHLGAKTGSIVEA